MKISIITVCFNSEATIELCLNSVASQSWANVEHIIVDGCSTDSTLQLIEENRQGNMVVVSEPDNGIYDAMNKGLSLATGDYVAYLNSDDLYTNEDVLNLVANKTIATSADCIIGDVHVNVKKSKRGHPLDFSCQPPRKNILPTKWARI